MVKEKKTILYITLAMVIAITVTMLNIISIGGFQDLLVNIIFDSFVFGLGLLGIIFFILGISYEVQEDEEIRKKKLFQIYIIAMILFGFYIILIILIYDFSNYIAYILILVSMLSSIIIIADEKIKEFIEKAKQNQRTD